MSGVLLVERVVAVLCLGHIVVNALHAIESIRTAIVLGIGWKASVDFTTIAAFLLSVTAVVRWAV